MSPAAPRSRNLAVVVVALVATVLVVGFIPGRARADDPSPTPTVTPTDSPTPTDTPSPTDTATPTPTPTATTSPSPASEVPSPSSSTVTGAPPGNGRIPAGLLPPGSQASGPHPHPTPNIASDQRSWKGWTPSTKWGTYSTALLDRLAARLRAHGASQHTILQDVYRPFIVEGPATWSDSWHAPRYTGGFHLHEGQDVLCKWGAPVLAAVSGRVSFGTDPLGGLGAFVSLPQGGHLYYAHLSEQRTSLAGTKVTPGEVIGRCGATGDATVPHVHFAWFDANNVAHDPMKLLVGFLHQAELRAVGRISAANPAAMLPPGIKLEAPPQVLPSGAATSEVAVAAAAAVVPVGGGGPSPWTMLALVLAVLLPAAAIRNPQVRKRISEFLSEEKEEGGDT
jgi:murein DD-endopeptidase MepM/ murein hydrolase activator NlpD